MTSTELVKHYNRILGQCSRIQIVCPGGVVTGGTESLHNLCHQLKLLGRNVELVYLGSNTDRIPKPFEHFNCSIGQLIDAEGTLVVIPEIYPMLALSLKRSKSAIWWLSRDNFCEVKYHSPRDRLRYWLAVLKGKRPLGGVGALRDLIHFSKAAYDGDFLDCYGIPHTQVVSPISRDFLSPTQKLGNRERKNVVLYNPKKGANTTASILSELGGVEFIPLQNCSNSELVQLYSQAKIYMDFGHHPGIERMPREAAAMGCCVLTGLLGSAGNSTDVPIKDCYKFDQYADTFMLRLGNTIQEIFKDFDSHRDNFHEIRSKVAAEPETQMQQLKQLFT